MSEIDAATEVLVPMQRLYAAPRGCASDAEKSKVLAEYRGSLGAFPAEVLRAAWRQVRDTHTRSTWPSIAVIVAECRKASPPPARISLAEQDGSRRRFCENRGLNADLMKRPNCWWMRPRDEWEPHWRESEVPIGERPNLRNRDGSMSFDPRIG